MTDPDATRGTATLTQRGREASAARERWSAAVAGATTLLGAALGIESAERRFSVKGLRIKTQRDKSDLLDVTFTISSFEAI